MIVSLWAPRSLPELVADAGAHDVGAQPLERDVEVIELGRGAAVAAHSMVECKGRAAEAIVQIFDAQHQAAIPQLPLGARARHPAEVTRAGAGGRDGVSAVMKCDNRVGELGMTPGGAASTVEQEFGADQEANASARGGKAIELGLQRADSSVPDEVTGDSLRPLDAGRAVVDLEPEDPALSPLPIVAAVAAEDRSPELGRVE